MNKIDKVEELLDMNNENIKSLYMSWDKGDCSTIGLIRILLIQEIEKEIKNRGVYYDGQYDKFLDGIKNNYVT